MINFQHLWIELKRFCRITKTYEIKDRYGFYEPLYLSPRFSDEEIYRVYYWEGFESILRAILRQTRSGFTGGHAALRIFRYRCYNDKQLPIRNIRALPENTPALQLDPLEESKEGNKSKARDSRKIKYFLSSKDFSQEAPDSIH